MFVSSKVYTVYARGGGIAHFNMATPVGNNSEKQPLTAYVLLYNLKTKPI